MRSRRGFLLLSAATSTAVALGATGLTACSTTTDDTTGGSPQDGGTLTYAASVEPDSWDPHQASTSVTARLLRPVFDSLVSLHADGTVTPWLATSWKVSDDGLRYTFRLREDVTFADGTRFDAAAVKANFDHVVAPKTVSKAAAPLLGPYERTEVLDRFTAVVHLKEAYASFLRSVASTFLGFHSPKALKEYAADLGSGGPHIVGSGPFRFVSYIAGQRATFERRADYRWAPSGAGHTGAARIDRIVVTVLPENASRVGAVTSGQADIAEQIPASGLASVRAQSGLSLARTPVPGTPYTFYLNTGRAPFDDVDVRRGVQSAIDLAAIVKGVFQGEYPRAGSPLTPATFTYDKTLGDTWGYDRARAARLLDAAGWTGRDSAGYRTKAGRRLTAEFPYVQSFVSSDNQSIAVGVQDALKKAGVELRLIPLDSASSMDRTVKGDYDVFAFGWESPDPAVLRNLYHSEKQFGKGGMNGARVHDAQLDTWLDRAQRTDDRAELVSLYRKVQRRVIDQAYAIPTYVASRDSAVRGRVHGLTFDAFTDPDLYDAWVSGS
ncbi:ABC transporter substrate-binding protein [Streptomyces hokutonensis]|uniref:ABC transporter substrate-binding protein n=1 Tax=Streptomyces hokutonensis TaxID=1306990 RepID=UPI0003700B41|nr:ABC transporter substrate-binding protein [Streptomyces hokutonensis]